MREDVPLVDIAALVQFADIMAKVYATGFVIIEAVDRAADLLQKPDRCAVADAKIPGSRDRYIGIIGNVGNSPIALELLDDGAVIAANHRSIEAAEIFLIEDCLALV